MATAADMTAMPQVEPVLPPVPGAVDMQPVAAPVPTPVSVQQTNPVMQDQVYPADPSQFQIPGM